jgi:hypothetical protein
MDVPSKYLTLESVAKYWRLNMLSGTEDEGDVITSRWARMSLLLELTPSYLVISICIPP